MKFSITLKSDGLAYNQIIYFAREMWYDRFEGMQNGCIDLMGGKLKSDAKAGY